MITQNITVLLEKNGRVMPIGEISWTPPMKVGRTLILMEGENIKDTFMLEEMQNVMNGVIIKQPVFIVRR